jgi:hypothetical protein
MHTEYFRLGTIADQFDGWMAKLGIDDPEYIDGHEADWYRLTWADDEPAYDLPHATIARLTDAELAETGQCAHCDEVVPVVTFEPCSECSGDCCPDCDDDDCPDLEAYDDEE